MKINGIKFDARNEVAVPIIRPKETIFFILQAMDDVGTVNAALKTIEERPKIVGARPGQPMKPIAANAQNRRIEAQNISTWLDGVVVNTIKYVTRDELVQTPIEEPAEGWGDTPEDERYVEEIKRLKYPMEWEQVVIEDPRTWRNWRDELRESRLNNPELDRIINGCLEANSITERSVEAAMADFLANPPELAELSESFPEEEAGHSQSGEPVNDSESDLPE